MTTPIEPLSTNTLALMYFGDVVFAVSGALTAARYQMDVLGFVLIGTITGIGGGVSHRPNIHLGEGRAWDDLSPLFSSTRINLNCTPWPRSCHHRVFQIAACRALAVTDWRDDAAALFEPDVEAVYFQSLSELPDIIDRFLSHPDEAEAIAEAGHRRFLAHHTAAHRMAELSNILNQLV